MLFSRQCRALARQLHAPAGEGGENQFPPEFLGSLSFAKKFYPLSWIIRGVGKFTISRHPTGLVRLRSHGALPKIRPVGEGKQL